MDITKKDQMSIAKLEIISRQVQMNSIKKIS